VDIRTFCAELAIATQWPDGGFTPLPIHGILPERGRQIGYLFNHYGVRADLTPDQAAGLQMALWEMIYDEPSNDPWNTGNFRYLLTDPQILANANFYLADAVGKSEYVAYHASNGPDFQSFFGTGSLNFGNVRLAGLAGWKWNDRNGDGIWDKGEVGLPGW